MVVKEPTVVRTLVAVVGVHNDVDLVRVLLHRPDPRHPLFRLVGRLVVVKPLCRGLEALLLPGGLVATTESDDAQPRRHFGEWRNRGVGPLRLVDRDVLDLVVSQKSQGLLEVVRMEPPTVSKLNGYPVARKPPLAFVDMLETLPEGPEPGGELEQDDSELACCAEWSKHPLEIVPE